jgi:hypothetical protein
MPQLVSELHKKYNRSNRTQVFTTKIDNNTIKLVEIIEAFEILGYDMSFNEIENWESPVKK